MKTLIYDWELHQGAAVDELIPVTGLPTTGVGVRCHIRDTLDALAPRLILSHDGPTNRRVTVSAEGIRIQIGATVSGGLVMVQPRNRWVYDVEVYSLTDADDVLKPRAGTVYAYREATRESDTTALPPLASGDGRYLRIDGDQGLTPEQQAWAQHNAGTTPGGPGGASDHGALSGLADDDHPQYLNAARGDARYDAIGAASAAVGAHAGATDPHGDRGFATAAVGTHAAAAGAHPISGVDGLAAALALLAPLLSPALTGTPTAPTAAPGTASTQIASTAFVAAAISALLNSAPGALDTLDELAAALGDDPNFATTVTNALSGKLAKASNLADLVDAAAARANLGATTIGGQVFTAADAAAIRALLALGGAALLGVGTTAGTVAAGDDSRFNSAIDSSRLPAPTTTALGGVKRNTGSAGQYVIGIDADGSLLRDTPAGGGGTKTLAVFLPNQNQPPASGFAQIDTRNSVLVLDFDSALLEHAIFAGIVPEGADLSSGIVVLLVVMFTTATSGNARVRIEFERGVTDADSDSWDTATEANVAADGTSGNRTTVEITCTNIDSIVAGDPFRVRIGRVGTDGTNDTAGDDMELVSVELRAA